MHVNMVSGHTLFPIELLFEVFRRKPMCEVRIREPVSNRVLRVIHMPEVKKKSGHLSLLGFRK